MFEVPLFDPETEPEGMWDPNLLFPVTNWDAIHQGCASPAPIVRTGRSVRIPPFLCESAEGEPYSPPIQFSETSLNLDSSPGLQSVHNPAKHGQLSRGENGLSSDPWSLYWSPSTNTIPSTCGGSAGSRPTEVGSQHSELTSNPDG